MKNLLIGSSLISLALASIAQGQVDSTSAPTDTYIDNIVDSATVHAAKVDVVAAQEAGVPPGPALRALTKNLSPAIESELQPMLAPPEERSFWLTKKISLTYGFNDTNSKLSDGAETTVNVAKTELYLESKTKFVLTTSFTFQNLSKTDDLGSLSDTNVYNFSVQPSQELFHLMNPATERRDQLVAGLGFGYSHFEGESSSKKGRSSSEADAYSISPNIVYAYPSRDKTWTITVSPTYTMQWKDMTVAGASGVNTNAGVFTFLGRFDHKVATGWTGSLSATWKHDVNQKVAPGQTAVFRDWAEFGCALRCEVSKSMRLKVGYSYEAFRSDFDTHKVTATAEIDF